jgi:plasmid stability protein
MGRPMIGVRLASEAAKEALEVLARAEGKSLSALVREMLSAELATRRFEHKVGFQPWASDRPEFTN